MNTNIDAYDRLIKQLDEPGYLAKLTWNLILYKELDDVPEGIAVYLEDRLENTITKLQLFGGCDHWAHFHTPDISSDKFYEKEDVDYREYNDYEYNTLWRCWDEMPSENQRKYAPWDDIKIDVILHYLTKYRTTAIRACDTDGYSDYYQREYDKAIIVLRELNKK